MLNFIMGIILGILITAVGLSGLAKMIDNGLDKTKETIQEQMK